MPKSCSLLPLDGEMGHNRGMKRSPLLIATAALLLWGGAYCVASVSAADPEKVEKALPAPGKPPVEKSALTKPPLKPSEKPAEKKPEKKPAEQLFDSFHLPLIIRLDLPEVPPEIRKPSAPIKQNPEPPKKMKWKFFFGRNCWPSANGLFV